MGKIFRCLSGSVTILVRGNQLERFLNLCRSRNISMEHIRRKEGQITARIKIRDFFRLRPVRNKTGVHIQVTEKQGMPFFFLRSKKRKAFFAGFSLGLVLLFFLSGRIWNIHIQGNVQNSKPEILEFLEKQGVSHGMAKASVSCSEIAAAVRKQFPEITWVSARIEGTRLILEIQEGISEKREVQEETPCDLTTLKSSILKYPFGLKSFLRLYFSDQMLIPQMNNPLYSFLVNHLHYPYMHIRIFLFLSFFCI